MTVQAQGTPTPESEELVRFREAWREELRQKKANAHQTEPVQLPPVGQSASSSHNHAVNHTTSPTSPRNIETEQLGRLHHHVTPANTIRASHGQSFLSPTLVNALQVYRQAVQCEQDGRLDDALRLYRQAFRISPMIDEVYHKEEQHQQVSPSQHHSHHRSSSNSSAVIAVESLAQNLDALTIKQDAVTGTMASLLAGFPKDLGFDPENEREGVPINSLPDELLVYFLRNLDTVAIEHFAAVNRKARVATLDPTIWRDFVASVYKPPQIAVDPASIAVSEYMGDYRRMYIEHPRIRYDGVYIAVCHYIRSGLSENAWVNVSHLITYHRYLRFLPDGQVLSLLSTEEFQPQDIIPILKHGLHRKGFYIGEWYLDGSTVYISSLNERADRHHIVPGRKLYSFQMSLNLRSRPLGRWNKLELTSYDSVEIDSGDIMSLPLRHERPFWFSKVRSYAAY